MAIDSRITYDLLAQLPEDGKRYELIDGDLFVSPSPIPRHQATVVNLAVFVHRMQGLGHGRGFVAPLDVVFDEYNVAEPDALFVITDNLHIITDKNIQGAPDLVVEVLSEGTAQRDLGVKMRMYARFRVPHYWVAEPSAQVLRRFELKGEAYVELPALSGDDTFTSPLFPGVEIGLAGFFG